jgi:uncharacterized membrane protein HdeD (DUF308 family)
MTMLTGVPDAAQLHARWKWFVGFGVVFVILGILALGNAVDATLVTTVIVGFLLIMAGIAQFVGSITGSGGLGGRALGLLIAVLYLLVGFDLVADPLQGAITLTIVVAIMMIVGGVFRIVGAFAERPQHWVLLVVVGVVNLLLGFWLWSGIPFTAPAIGIFVGLDLLMAGITWVVMGWMARSMPATSAAAVG